MHLVVPGPGHPFRGGIAQTTTALVQALVERGHLVRYLTPSRQYPALLYPGGDDRDPEACPRLACARRAIDPFAPHRWARLRRECFAPPVDACLMPYWTWAWAPWWRFLLGGPARPPVVAVVHNPQDHDAGWLQRLAARAVLGRAEGLFTHAETLADDLRRRYPGVPVAAHALPAVLGFELEERDHARARLEVPRHARVALFLGLIRDYKGVDLLLEALAQPGGRGWRLLVVGEPWGDLGARLERQVDRLGLAGRVRLDLRWVSEREMQRALAAADVVVLPYRAGSQSAVAPLALGCGVPVLSTRVGGLPEVVEHGVNGVLVEPGSVDELAGALASLDRETLERLAAGARATAGRHTWSSYAEALEGLLDTVVGTTLGPPSSSSACPGSPPDERRGGG